MVASPLPPYLSLAEYLQEVTEALAASRTPGEIFRIVLGPALTALGGVAGVVLMLDDTGADLNLGAYHGSPGTQPSPWQLEPRDEPSPVWDALNAAGPLFFEDQDSLLSDYPGLWRRSGTQLPMACAVVPLLVHERPLGILIIDFCEPHLFSLQERRFLGTLATQCALALALDRAERCPMVQAEVSMRTLALDAFVAFSEAVGTHTQSAELAQRAIQTIQANVAQVGVAYYELETEVWKAKCWSAEVLPDVAELIQRGIPQDSPLFLEGARSTAGMFTDDWTVHSNELPGIAVYQAVASMPIRGQTDAPTQRLLVLGKLSASTWSEHERAVVRAVCRGLSLAVERSEAARQLAVQNAELASRTRVLEVFAQITADLSVEVDPYALVQQAQAVVASMLPDGYLLYFEQEDGRWRNRVQTGDVRNTDLQTFNDAGPKIGQTPSVDRPWTTQQALFQDRYQQGTDTPPELVEHVLAVASLPVIRQGQSVGVLVAALFEQRSWTRHDKVVLETVARNLGLALERSVQTQALDNERAGLDAFAAFTEAVGSEVDLLNLARRAARTLRQALPDVSVGYYEVEDKLWKARAWSEDIAPETVAQMREGVPQDAKNFAQAVNSRAPVFNDGWDAAANYLPSAERYGAAAFLPIFVRGEPRSILAAGVQTDRAWTKREQAVLRAVSHSLGLALERAEATQRLEAERAALNAFVAFTEAVGDETDVLALARQAALVVRASLPTHSFAYFEPEAELWRARAWSVDIAPEIVAQIRAGLPSTAPNVAQALRSRQPLFIDGWDAVSEHVSAAASYGAAAFIPLLIQGEVQALATSGSQESRAWTPREQGVIRAVVRSLGLALERSDQTRQLQRQRDELDAAATLLAASNAELEAFAYSVSHDLRTPVRHVLGYAELAQQAQRSGQPGKLERYLEVMRQSGLRMNALIDGMLMLSSTGQGALTSGWVDLGALVEQACRDATSEFAAQGVEWRLGALPLVWGDPGLLQQVMTNLLSNAVKYSAPRERSEIQVSADDLGAAWIISVRDNGVGFDEAYASRLFGVFQRLHREQDFAGTGVGLATIRRIVLRHGGQVFARSLAGQGATFGFTLPKPQTSPR